MVTEKVRNILKEKGVTLIALVITIIVLLILAGITLNLALGKDGIIARAKDVAQKYKEAEQNELKHWNELENQLLNIAGKNDTETNNTKLIKKIELSKHATSIEKGKNETLEVTIEPEYAENKELKWDSSNPQVATVENGEITALEVGTTEITVTSTDGSEVSDTCTVKVTTLMSSIAKPGDYVKYKPEGKEFTMTPEQTGQDKNQTFNTANYNDLWQVLYNDDEHGLQIISTNNVEMLIIGLNDNIDGARTGYNNCVETLNSFCTNYVDPRYAESGRSVGSEKKDKVSETVELPFEYNGNADSGCLLASEATQEDYDAMLAAKSQNNNGIAITDGQYYYAQRQLWKHDVQTHNFQVRIVRQDALILGGTFIEFRNADSASFNAMVCGVRPCITLKSGMQVTGSGTKDSPFELTPM